MFHVSCLTERRGIVNKNVEQHHPTSHTLRALRRVENVASLNPVDHVVAKVKRSASRRAHFFRETDGKSHEENNTFAMLWNAAPPKAPMAVLLLLAAVSSAGGEALGGLSL